MKITETKRHNNMKRQADKPEKMEVTRDSAIRAIQSIIDAYKDTAFKFYGRDSLNLMCHVTYIPNKVERLRDDVAILKGNIEYEGEMAKGTIKVDLKKKVVFYAPARGDGQDPLLVDNRTKKEWDAFLSELKSVHDRIIASAKDAASAMEKAAESCLQALTHSIFSEVSSSVVLLFFEYDSKTDMEYPIDFNFENICKVETDRIVFYGDVTISYHKPTKGCIVYNHEEGVFSRGHLTGRGNVKIDMPLEVDDTNPENVALLNKLTTHISNFVKGKDKEHNS